MRASASWWNGTLDYWQFFAYDVENCEVLLTAQRPTGNAAKLAALEFALIHTFGPEHDLNPQVLATMLVWQSC